MIKHSKFNATLVAGFVFLLSLVSLMDSSANQVLANCRNSENSQNVYSTVLALILSSSIEKI